MTERRKTLGVTPIEGAHSRRESYKNVCTAYRRSTPTIILILEG
jgi:hypothetical protein